MSETESADGNGNADSGGSSVQRLIDFTTLLLSVREAALLALGLMPDHTESPDGVDLAAARTQIDLVDVLEEKTRGNLTDDEKKLVDSVLYELRVAWVKVKGS